MRKASRFESPIVAPRAAPVRASPQPDTLGAVSNPPNTFQGERVRLRGIAAHDWERFHADATDTESARFYDRIRLPRSPEAARRWAEERAQRSDDDDRMLAIESRAGQLVGAISTSHADARHGTFRYGLGIFREARRHGYGSEAIRLLLRFYFDELRYQKVNADVYAFNEPSIKLHEKLGFTLEGRIRRAYYSQGAYHDELVYGMTAEEFRALGL